MSTGIVSATLLLSGIKIDGGTADAIDSQGKLIVKLAMLVLPMLLIIAGYIVYLKKYKIDEKFYGQIVTELQNRT